MESHTMAGLGVPARVVRGAAGQVQKIRYGERLATDPSTAMQRIEGGGPFTPKIIQGSSRPPPTSLSGRPL